MNNVIARWETRGKDWLELYRHEGMTMLRSGSDTERLPAYGYRGNGCGGGFGATDDADAISRMEAPWGDPRGTGQVTVLKTDRSSLRRVK